MGSNPTVLAVVTYEQMLDRAFKRACGTPYYMWSEDLNNLTNIYFIGNPSTDNIKIDVSKNPYQRIKTLQTGSPIQLFVVALIRNRPKELESYLHRTFSKQRMWGEWFQINDDLFRFIWEFKVSDFEHLTNVAASAIIEHSGVR